MDCCEIIPRCRVEQVWSDEFADELHMTVHVIKIAFRRKITEQTQHIIRIETVIRCYSVCLVERIHTRMNVFTRFNNHLHLPCWTLLRSDGHNILHAVEVIFLLQTLPIQIIWSKTIQRWYLLRIFLQFIATIVIMIFIISLSTGCSTTTASTRRCTILYFLFISCTACSFIKIFIIFSYFWEKCFAYRISSFSLIYEIVSNIVIKQVRCILKWIRVIMIDISSCHLRGAVVIIILSIIDLYADNIN